MKTINLTLYNFDELSDEVQKVIIDRERWSTMEQCMEGYKSEYLYSLNKFEELMNISVPSWNVGYSGSNFTVNIKTIVTSEWRYEKSGDEIYDCLYLENLSGTLLLRYLQKNVLPHLFIGKCYRISKYHNEKHGWSKRFSKIIKECSCPLTGYIYDMALLEPIFGYLEKPDLEKNYEDLINMCIESFFQSWHKEYEYWGDDEDAIRENLHTGQYENQLYYNDGTEYNGPIDCVA